MTLLRVRGIFAAVVSVNLLLFSQLLGAVTSQPTTAPTTSAVATTQSARQLEIKKLESDATDAFTRGDDAKAMEILDRLLQIAPEDVNYHLLDARALALQGKWKEASGQADWVIAHATHEYQKEWANLVRAQAATKTGDKDTARSILKNLSANASSPAVKTTASQLIEQLEP